MPSVNPYAVRRPVDNEFLVRERDRRRIRELLRLVALLAPVALALLVYTWVHLERLDTAYDIRALEAELHQLERRERQLELERAYRSSPGRVARRAGEELGLVAPTVHQVVRWPEDFTAIPELPWEGTPEEGPAEPGRGGGG